MAAKVLPFGELCWDYMPDLVKEKIEDLAARSIHQEKMRAVCEEMWYRVELDIGNEITPEDSALLRDEFFRELEKKNLRESIEVYGDLKRKWQYASPFYPYSIVYKPGLFIRSVKTPGLIIKNRERFL